MNGYECHQENPDTLSCKERQTPEPVSRAIDCEELGSLNRVVILFSENFLADKAPFNYFTTSHESSSAWLTNFYSLIYVMLHKTLESVLL